MDRNVYDGIEDGRKGNDCAFAAQAHEITAIPAENPTAGIQAFNPACIADDQSTRGNF
jgi:hypothetical protein